MKLSLDKSCSNDTHHDDNNQPQERPKDYNEESDIHPDIAVHLKFSDTKTMHLTLKTGDTVQNIKKRLEAEHGIQYSKITFTLDGKTMLDPLSLNDFPAVNESVKQNTNLVVIDVDVSTFFDFYLIFFMCFVHLYFFKAQITLMTYCSVYCIVWIERFL